MKKNNVTLAAILPLLGGFQKIKVVDQRERYVEPDAEVIYEDYKINMNPGTLTDDQKRAKVIGIRSLNGVIIISLCTAWEAKGML